MTVKSEVSVLRDLKLRKYEVLEAVAKSMDEEVIAAIEEVLRQKFVADYEKEMSTPLTVDEYADGIKQAMDEADRGEGMDEEEYLKFLEETEGEHPLKVSE